MGDASEKDDDREMNFDAPNEARKAFGGILTTVAIMGIIFPRCEGWLREDDHMTWKYDHTCPGFPSRQIAL